MNLDNLTIEEDVKVEFSDKDNWAEIVNFKEIINTILEFIKKLFKFEF